MPSAGISITNTFAAQSGNIPLSTLDVNFAQLVGVVNSLNSFANYFVDTGVANALAVSLPASVTATLTAGLQVQVLVAVTNTGASTLTFSGALVASAPITTVGLAALTAGQLKGGSVVTLIYDGAQFQLQGTATASSLSNLSITATAGVGLAVTNSSSSFAATITNTNGGGNSNGLSITAGSGAGDTAFQINNATGAYQYLVMNGAGATTLAPHLGVALAITPAAGASGLTITSTAATFAVQLASNQNVDGNCLYLNNTFGTTVGALRVDGSSLTGVQTATFVATNKPGSGTTAPSTWLHINLGGTVYYIPCWQ